MESVLRGAGADARRTPTGEHWVDDDARTHCLQCRQGFTMFRRRHHCRQCGEVFCNACCPEKQVRMGTGMEKMRQCKSCARLPQQTPPAVAGMLRRFQQNIFCCAA